MWYESTVRFAGKRRMIGQYTLSGRIFQARNRQFSHSHTCQVFPFLAPVPNSASLQGPMPPLPYRKKHDQQEVFA